MQRKGSLVLHGVKALALAAQAEVKPLEHPTLHAMVILVDDLFGSNQTQSDAIRGHQRSSVDLFGSNQTQSDAIRGHQWSSVDLFGSNQTQSDAIRRNQTQSDAIRRNQTQSRTCLDASHAADQWPFERARRGVLQGAR